MNKQLQLQVKEEIRTGSKFLNDDNKDLSEFIKKDKTIVFTDYSKAKEYAEHNKTYFSELFILIKSNSKKQFFGYGVSK